MYKPGLILYFDPFYFKNGERSKAKYFIVLDNDGKNTVLASLPTSKDHIPSNIQTLHGCINDDSINFNCYHFEAGTIICTNGWCFGVPTFVYGSQVEDYDINILEECYQVEGIEYNVMGELTVGEYKKLIACLVSSGSVKRRIKKVLEKYTK